MYEGVVIQARESARRAIVPVDDVISLVARATASKRFLDLGFSDPAAEALLAELEGISIEVDESRLRAALMTTMVIDGIVRDFFRRNPNGVAAAIHPGLCSRFSRVDNGELQWVDIDTPAVASLKCAVLRTPSRHAIAAACGPCCRDWLDAVASVPTPLLFVHQGAARRAEEFADHFDRIVGRVAAGTEYVLDYDARLPVRPSALARERASLELACAGGAALRYPRARLVAPDEYLPELRDEVEGLNGVSRIKRGIGVPSVAHVRFV